MIPRWFAPWGLSTVVCCYCRVRPLQIFLTAQSLWDRRLLRLAHWPCSMSGPMGAQEAWESQFVKGTSVTHNTEHVQTLDYTRLVFVDFAEPAIQVWIRVRTCKGLWFATLKVNQSVVCCRYGSDLCDFIWQLSACLCREKRVSNMKWYRLLVSSLIHHRTSILRRCLQSYPFKEFSKQKHFVFHQQILKC